MMDTLKATLLAYDYDHWQWSGVTQSSASSAVIVAGKTGVDNSALVVTTLLGLGYSATRFERGAWNGRTYWLFRCRP
jgi:hypothetical protein